MLPEHELEIRACPQTLPHFPLNTKRDNREPALLVKVDAAWEEKGR